MDTGIPYRYLQYKMRARYSRGRGVHPPFAYQIIRQALFGQLVPELEIIEKIRKSMLKNKQKIRIMDHGAGSRTRMTYERSVRNLARHTSVSSKYGQVLARMVQILQPDTVIELGTGTGLSSLYMGLAIPTGKIITCEACTSIAEIAELNFLEAGASNIEIRNGTFASLLPGLLNQSGKDLFLFMDGDHREDSVWSMFTGVLESGNSTGVIILDDINWSDGMRRVWKEIIRHPSISLSIETFRMGIAFCGWEVQKDHFIVNF